MTANIDDLREGVLVGITPSGKIKKMKSLELFVLSEDNGDTVFRPVEIITETKTSRNIVGYLVSK